MKPIWKHIITSVFALSVCAYLISSVMVAHRQLPTIQCSALHINIQDKQVRQYIDEQEIEQLIRSNNLYPVGRAIHHIPYQAIEDIVLNHDMVYSSECYYTIDGQVHIDLTQRIPLLHVVTLGDNYYIDVNRQPMPTRPTITTRVLPITGNVSHRMAENEAYDFAQWLQKNDFWRARIARVRVVGPRMIHLIQADSAATIVLGEWTGFEGKLNKLRRWYEHSQGVEIDQYQTVDIRYKGQVLGLREPL